MLTNREQGDYWESQVLEILGDVIPDLKKTVGSGSVFGDQDLVSHAFRVSVKLRDRRGLTLKELNEPYISEPIGSIRAPITVLRSIMIMPDELFSDFVYLDGKIILEYGKALLLMALDHAVDTVSILEPAPGNRFGLTPTLLNTVPHRHAQFIWGVPDGKLCLLLRLRTFIDFMTRVNELIADQKKDVAGYNGKES